MAQKVSAFNFPLTGAGSVASQNLVTPKTGTYTPAPITTPTQTAGTPAPYKPTVPSTIDASSLSFVSPPKTNYKTPGLDVAMKRQVQDIGAGSMAPIIPTTPAYKEPTVSSTIKTAPTVTPENKFNLEPQFQSTITEGEEPGILDMIKGRSATDLFLGSAPIVNQDIQDYVGNKVNEYNEKARIDYEKGEVGALAPLIATDMLKGVAEGVSRMSSGLGGVLGGKPKAQDVANLGLGAVYAFGTIMAPAITAAFMGATETPLIKDAINFVFDKGNDWIMEKTQQIPIWRDLDQQTQKETLQLLRGGIFLGLAKRPVESFIGNFRGAKSVEEGPIRNGMSVDKAKEILAPEPGETLNDAFKRNARKTHPDIGGTKEAFQEVNTAYQTLMDAGIKEFTNTATKDPGFFQSMIDLAKKVIKGKEKTAGALEEGISGEPAMYQQKVTLPEEGNLKVLHNTNISKLGKSLELGGLPLPSIAITKKGIPFDAFGDISFIGDKNLVTPSEDTHVFAGDVYTTRVPGAQYNVWNYKTSRSVLTPEELTKVNEEIQPDETWTVPEVINQLKQKNVEGADEIIQKLNKIDKPFLMSKEQNPTGTLKEFIDSNPKIKKQFIAADDMNDFVMQVENDYDLYNIAEKFAKQKGYNTDENGLYEMLQKVEKEGTRFDDYNLSTVVKKAVQELKLAGDVRGQEGWGFQPGRIQALRKFADLKDIKSAKDFLENEEKVLDASEQIDKSAQQTLNIVIDGGLKDYNQYQIILGDLLKKQGQGTLTKQDIVDVLVENGQKLSTKKDYQEHGVPRLIEDLKAYQGMTQSYFEAKKMRAVDFKEFKAIAVPKENVENVKSMLKNKGIKMDIVEYDKNISEDRQNKIEQYMQDQNLFFQKKQGGNLPAKEYSPITPSKAVETVRKYFTESEISTEIAEKIMSPRGLEAFGKYKDRIISFAKNPVKSTPEHEVLHAYFDVFTSPERRVEIIKEIKKEQGFKNSTEAEEWMADKFVEYVRDVESGKPGPKTISEKIRQFFKEVWETMKKVFGNEDKVKQLFADIIKKNRNYVKEKFGGKEKLQEMEPRQKEVMDQIKTSDPVYKDFVNRVQKIEAEEQRIGKIGKNKVSKAVSDQQMRTREKNKERVLKDMQQEYNYDADQAVDFYDSLRDLPVKEIDAINEKYIPGKEEVTMDELINDMETVESQHKLPKEKVIEAKKIVENMQRARDKGKDVKEIVEYNKLQGLMNSKDKNFSEDRYKQNQAKPKEGVKIWKKGKELLNHLLDPISHRLGKINPMIKTRLREFEYRVGKNIKKDLDMSQDFFDQLKEVRKDPIKFNELDLALKNGDTKKIQELGIKVPRDVLDDLYERAREAGFDLDYLKDYFPRVVKDSKGLIGILKGTESWGAISDAIKAREESLGRSLSIDEKAEIANKLLQGFSIEGVRIGSKNFEERSLETIDANLNKFYMDSGDAFITYLKSVNEAIQMKKLFGSEDIEKGVGDFVAKMIDEGKITPEQEMELAEMLKARFNQKAINPFVSAVKSITYLTTMGSPISALSQLQDLANPIYKNGIANVVRARKKGLPIKMSDIGLHEIYEEFSDKNKLDTAVSTVFRWVGLEKLDKLGKETLINSTFENLTRKAKKDDPELKKTLHKMFDSPEREVKIIESLKEGKLTDDGKFLLFNQVSDFQPITLSEMPETYLKNPNGRIFYALKTFTLKQIEGFRREGFDITSEGKKEIKAAKEEYKLGKINKQEYKKRIYEGEEKFAKGINNIAKLAAMLMIMGIGTDEIKDFVLGRSTSNIWKAIYGEDLEFGDRMVDNAWRLLGFSKYATKQAQEEGAGKTVLATILPSVNAFDNLSKDISYILKDGKDDWMKKLQKLNSYQNIPLIGKLGYRWFGRPRSTKGGYGPFGKKLPDSEASTSTKGSLDLNLDLDMGKGLDLDLSNLKL